MAIIDTEKLTDEELAAIGEQVVAWFGLKLKKEKGNRYYYNTAYGTKTVEGLGRVAVRLVLEKGKPV